MSLPHPFPYQGSKRGIAKVILSFFPEKTGKLIEPFAGSGAVSIAAAFYGKAESFVLNDINAPLIALWKMIVYHPQTLSDQYRLLWNQQQSREHEFYDKVRKHFNRDHRPDHLLYLLARCVKGSVRYNENGEFNQSPDNRRKGMHPDKMSDNIYRISHIFREKITLSRKDYKDILKAASCEDLIYMDPPYQGVCGKDGRYINTLSYMEYVNTLSMLNKRGISFLVSYDGRTGDKIYGKHIPESLGLTRIEIPAGRSAQATLLGMKCNTYESLYLSPNLKERSACCQEIRQKQLSLF